MPAGHAEQESEPGAALKTAYALNITKKAVFVQEALIHRLQEPCWGPSLPIELAGQEAFVAMLQCAAVSQQDIISNMQSLHSALHFDGKPAAW